MPWFRWSAELVRLWKMSKASEILPRLRSPSRRRSRTRSPRLLPVAVPVVRKGVQARHERRVTSSKKLSLTSCWTAETPLSVIFGAMAFFFSLI